MTKFNSTSSTNQRGRANGDGLAGGRSQQDLDPGRKRKIMETPGSTNTFVWVNLQEKKKATDDNPTANKKERWRSHATKELQGGTRMGNKNKERRPKCNWVSLSTRPLLPLSEMMMCTFNCRNHRYTWISPSAIKLTTRVCKRDKKFIN